MMNLRPRIGILPDLQADDLKLKLSPDYARAIHAFGGTPLILPYIPPGEREVYADSVGPWIHGILLPGSPFDVEPDRYHQTVQPATGPVSRERDEHDSFWIQWAKTHGVPILGICYGCQILNVVFGGTLIQDIATARPNALDHKPAGRSRERVHEIRFESRILRLPELREQHHHVNSSHHQAIDQLAEGFTPVAWADDGILEAFEWAEPEPWILGVQWHPELIYTIDPASAAVFRAFVKAARARSHARPDKTFLPAT